MGKRFEQKNLENVLGVIETATGGKLPPEQRKLVARGAEEIDIVNSGLEETMVAAYREIHQIWKSDARIQTLRTAAFISAIKQNCHRVPRVGNLPVI